MDIDTMPADRKMNTLVALHVMEWHQWDGLTDFDGSYPMFCHGLDGRVAVYDNEEAGNAFRYFDPSEDIAAAWEVVEKEATQRRFLKLTAYSDSPFRGGGLAYWGADFMGTWGREAFGDTECIAICRASLKGYAARKAVT